MLWKRNLKLPSLAQIEKESPEQKTCISCCKKATERSSFCDIRNTGFFVRTWNEKLEIAPENIMR